MLRNVGRHSTWKKKLRRFTEESIINDSPKKMTPKAEDTGTESFFKRYAVISVIGGIVIGCDKHTD